MVGVASIGIGWVTLSWVAIGVATCVVSWVEAGAAWYLAAGGITGLAIDGFLCCSLAGMHVEFGCVSAYCFPIIDSPGVD